MKCLTSARIQSVSHAPSYDETYSIEALKIRQLRLPESEKVAVTHEKIGSLARGMGKAKKAQIAFEGKNLTANV